MQNFINAIFELVKPERKDNCKNLFNILFGVDYQLPGAVIGKRPSLVAFDNSYYTGSSVESSLASALLTLNSNHGPFAGAYEVITKFYNKNVDIPKINAILQLTEGTKIPGFGNPVFKISDDRCEEVKNYWAQIDLKSFEEYDKISKTITQLLLNVKGKIINSNITFWNAAVIHYAGLPKTHASMIFILAIQLKYINKIWQQ